MKQVLLLMIKTQRIIRTLGRVFLILLLIFAVTQVEARGKKKSRKRSKQKATVVPTKQEDSLNRMALMVLLHPPDSTQQSGDEDWDSEAIDSLVNDNFATGHIFGYLKQPAFSGDSIFLCLVDSTRSFAMPNLGKIISPFGPRGRRMHKGLDIKLNKGDEVFSAFDGVVRFASYGRGFGNIVVIRHFNGLETYYAHLSQIKVKAYQPVKAGELIALGGSTGRARGPHLHFEIRFQDKPFDPTKIIDFDSASLKTPQLWVSRELFGKSKNLSTTGANGEKYHIIRKGDTLGKIAKKYGVSIKQIQRLNRLKSSTVLRVGKRIKIR